MKAEVSPKATSSVTEALKRRVGTACRAREQKDYREAVIIEYVFSGR